MAYEAWNLWASHICNCKVIVVVAETAPDGNWGQGNPADVDGDELGDEKEEEFTIWL